MRLAYVTRNDSTDIHDFSGLTYYINRALNDSGIQTIPIGNLKEGYHYITTGVKKVLYKRFLSKEYARNLDPAILKYVSIQIDHSLSSIECDAVFGQESNLYLRTKKPIVYWNDATFAGLYKFKPEYNTNYCDETIRNGNMVEQLILSKCRLAIFSSEWAADTALKYYDVDPVKVKVVPFGANIECHRDIPEIKKILSNKNFDVCKLLFVGVEWFRKGGDAAVKIAGLLNKIGLQTELHVVGCRPPGEMPEFVKQYGFISKKTEQGRNLLDDVYSKAHFLILPTRAECCAIVFAEASSFGLPSLATDVGGVTTAIHNGKNGQTFSPTDDPEQYCQYILYLMANRQEYERLSLSSFQEYTERLNWKTAGQKMHDLILEFCGPK
jgi:glycosyltransferase involved in cell wall biosynthesis